MSLTSGVIFVERAGFPWWLVAVVALVVGGLWLLWDMRPTFLFVPVPGGAAAARRAHNPRVEGSSPSPATNLEEMLAREKASRDEWWAA